MWAVKPGTFRMAVTLVHALTTRQPIMWLLFKYLFVFFPPRYALHFLVQTGLSYSIMVFASLEHMHK